MNKAKAHPQPPFTLLIKKRSVEDVDVSSVEISSTPLPPPSPYPEDSPVTSKIHYTPKQVEAIRSGMNEGLTLIVGPPGTGTVDHNHNSL